MNFLGNNSLASDESKWVKNDCGNLFFYQTYAQCHIKDDISPNLRKTFMIIFLINFALLIKNIMNIIKIRKLSNFKKVRDMAVFNVLLLPTILLQMILYANSFWLELRMSGYSLLVYGLIEIAQVLALNNLFSLGAYFWIKMMLKLSFNNKRVVTVKAIFILCLIMNLVFFLIVSLLFYNQHINNNTLWSDIEGVTRLMYILTTISTFVSGLFFSLGVFYGVKLSRESRKRDQPNKKVALNLAILAALISTLRILQDFVQSFGTVLSDIKLNSVINNDWSFPIYVMVFLLIANIIPETIFLIKYSPNRSPRPYMQGDKSETQTTNPSDDPMYTSSNNKSITLLISE